MSSSDKIPHNVYFDGKVQSLGIDTEKGKATVGVMKKGSYVCNLSSKVSGGDWLAHKKNDAFDIAANTSFEVMCETDVAYICYYN
jgi:uncharacterized protein YaiE (UPF0345 family)